MTRLLPESKAAGFFRRRPTRRRRGPRRPAAFTGTIFPLSPLPAIADPVLIDGESQPNYAGTPLIEINGSQAGRGDGLTITGPGVTVRGLDVNSFSQGAGILISGTGAAGNVIADDDVGTDPSGSQALPNYFGIRLLGGAHANLVGGSTAASGDLIAGNFGPGVSVEGDTSVGNQITADRIFANGAPPTPPPSETLFVIWRGRTYVMSTGQEPLELPKQYGMGAITQACGPGPAA